MRFKINFLLNRIYFYAFKTIIRFLSKLESFIFRWIDFYKGIHGNILFLSRRFLIIALLCTFVNVRVRAFMCANMQVYHCVCLYVRTDFFKIVNIFFLFKYFLDSRFKAINPNQCKEHILLVQKSIKNEGNTWTFFSVGIFDWITSSRWNAFRWFKSPGHEPISFSWTRQSGKFRSWSRNADRIHDEDLIRANLPNFHVFLLLYGKSVLLSLS